MPEVIDKRAEQDAPEVEAVPEDFSLNAAKRISKELARLSRAVEDLAAKVDGLDIFVQDHLYMAAGGPLAEMQNTYTNQVASIGRQVLNAQNEQARVHAAGGAVPTG